jgi:V/A-type H+-transporting ATPase subunit A
VQRPLEKMLAETGAHVARGKALPPLDRERRWKFRPADIQMGKRLEGGAVLGTVQETDLIEHRVLAPPDVSGEIVDLAPAGEYTIEQCIARVRTGAGTRKLRLYHRWPVRKPRPYRRRDESVAPLVTGQRILDTFFPLLKGGKAAIPGPFGAGKTVLQHQLARWCNASIVTFVGCGERGNELVEVLDTFPRLKDPHSGRPLMERTLLLANTSNMPVVAREASIYAGVTIAEYYRDQGYDVVMVADSTSRWAEALREVSGRLGQMPVEEGYPAYLASRIAALYERAGRVEALNGRCGSVTIIGAVSPPGGDFSEPVTSHTKDMVQTFWALSKELADARHYPAVDWTESFSEYVEAARRWWSENVDPDWARKREEALGVLAQADELQRIVNLVGPEALSAAQRWTLEGASLIKDAVLQQSAVDPADSFSSPEKQLALLDLVLEIIHEGRSVLELGAPVQELVSLPLLGEARRYKSTYPSDKVKELRERKDEIHKAFETIRAEYRSAAEGKSEGKP